MRLNAGSRLQLTEAMTIKRGVNFSEADANELVSNFFQEFYRRGTRTKLTKSWVKGSQWFLILQDSKEILLAVLDISNLQPLATLFIETYDTIGKANYRVNSVYVSKALRGKGYGTALYTEAHDLFGSLCSSDSIGTLAVALWSSLARKYPDKITLVDHSGKPIKGEVDFSGSIPTIDGKAINNPNVGDVFFIWE